ncbi:MAG: sodium:proton exchanger [Desulfobulbaceae bacterium BRH_c16a]|nr:MAG: sodium:proton exchanger [Desulfobulbaceae bacterium BRH_c16a]
MRRMNDGSSFIEIASILSLATLLGILGQKLRQPLIIMFLATGILAGPSGLGIIHSYDQIELLAHIGIALLLFIVGLKLDLHLIRTTGPVALATGLGQIVFTSIIGFAIAVTMNMSFLTAAYVSVALTFSSTIIIVKLLSDKKEIDSLHGQIAIGFLIIQDIAAILALVVLTTIGESAQEESSYVTTLIIFAKGLGLLGVIALLTKYVLPHLTRRLAHSLELLTLFAIAWAVFLGAGSEFLGFSKEVGAFLAGVSLASTDYRDSIGARLTSLRDFLLLFFFIDLGARLDWSTVGSQVGASLVFSLFVLIGNPLIVLVIMGWMGYRRRTSFLAGLTVAQISEFSLIVAALGLSIGHITSEAVGLVTLVGVVTIFISTYMILYSGPLYNLLSVPLKVFERRNPYREAAIDTLKGSTASLDIILVGLGNYGSGIAEYLLRRNNSILGIDFDPGALDKWRVRGLSVLYGDMADPEIHEHLPLNKTRWLISTVRSEETNLALVRTFKNRGYGCKLALTATNENEAREFKNAGAHLVFRPFADAAEQAADALAYAMDFLPEMNNWPVSFLDVYIKSDAAIAGQTIKDIPVRSIAGISILAVSRGGQVDYDPEPDFRIFPGDRLLIMGPPDGLKDAEMVLNKLEMRKESKDEERFKIAEVRVADDSGLSGQTPAGLRFRQRYGVTLIGIRRGEDRITAINPAEQLLAGDVLIIIGKAEAVRNLKKQEPLK